MPLLMPGLVSNTFRHLPPADIVALVREAGVYAVEWSSDTHVPPGDVQNALAVAAQTHKARIRLIAYGSSYHAGVTNEHATFERTLQTAAALGAPLIRVYAGSCNAEEVDTRTWKHVVNDLNRICALARKSGIGIATAFQEGTLCNTADSAIRVLTQAESPNLHCFWQPLGDATPEERAAEVGQILPHLAHVHVYHRPQGNPAPLADGEDEWKSVLIALADAGRPVALLMAHAAGDDPQQFLKDAATLRGWIKNQA